MAQFKNISKKMKVRLSSSLQLPTTKPTLTSLANCVCLLERNEDLGIRPEQLIRKLGGEAAFSSKQPKRYPEHLQRLSIANTLTIGVN